MAKKEVVNNSALTVRVNAEPILDAIEDTIDATEQALDIIDNSVDKVVTVTKNNPFLIAGALLIGIGVGGFVAYKVTQKRLAVQFEAELMEEIAKAKEFHARLAKTGDFETPEGAVEALVPAEVVSAVSSYQGRERVSYNKPETIQQEDPRPPVEVVVEEAVVTQNVFVNAKADPRDWDYALEIADREANPDQPYVISFDEFQENKLNHEQATLAYYEKDDTLADEKDQPIDNTDYTVGDDNLTRFGHGSNDRNVVYVRNEKISMDFEIIRSGDSYSKQVLGFEPEPSIRHSHRRAARRRSADE